jgi:RsiW-degrading membrane proteinase PrsW (M82 family)
LQAEFRQLRFDRIFPLGAWLRDQPWNVPWVRWFLLYALFPFILVQSTRNLDQTAWGFGLYFAITWLIVLSFCMRPEKVNYELLLAVWVTTAVLGVAVVLYGQKLPLISALYAATEQDNPIGRWLGFTLGVGPLEEAAKALPLYVFIYRGYMLRGEHRTYQPHTLAFIGAASGLAFGVNEGVLYANRYAHGLAQAGISYETMGEYVSVQILRFISLPLLHACWSGIVGYFMGLAALHTTAPRALVLTGLAIAAVLHGTYDTFASGWIGVGLAALTILVFISYVRSADAIAAGLMAADPVVEPGAAEPPGAGG